MRPCSSVGVFQRIPPLTESFLLSVYTIHLTGNFCLYRLLGIEVPLVSIVSFVADKQDPRFEISRCGFSSSKSPDTGRCGTLETETFFRARRDLFLAHATTHASMQKSAKVRCTSSSAPRAGTGHAGDLTASSSHTISNVVVSSGPCMVT